MLRALDVLGWRHLVRCDRLRTPECCELQQAATDTGDQHDDEPLGNSCPVDVGSMVDGPFASPGAGETDTNSSEYHDVLNAATRVEDEPAVLPMRGDECDHHDGHHARRSKRREETERKKCT